MSASAPWLAPQHASSVLRAAAAITLLASLACSDESPAATSPSTSAGVPAAGVPAAGAGAASGSAGASGSTSAAGSGGAAPDGGVAADSGMPDAAVACRVPDTLPVTGEDADGGIDPKCRDIPRTIFAEHCTGFCHNAVQRPSGNLNLLSPCVADRLLDRRSTCENLLLIDSARVEQSFLLDKLQNMKPRCGASMPDGWHLPPEQVACVTAWVNAVVRASP